MPRRKRGLTVVELTCPTCGRMFERRKSAYLWNKSKGHTSYCSRTCAAQASRGREKGFHGTLTGYYECGPPPCEACQRAMDEWKQSLQSIAP